MPNAALDNCCPCCVSFVTAPTSIDVFAFETDEVALRDSVDVVISPVYTAIRRGRASQETVFKIQRVGVSCLGRQQIVSSKVKSS